jgi:ubiquinone/menaquinone biosynthesis C-methylase UbiE
MNYDNTAIAATYDAARGYRPDVLRQWLDIIAGNTPHRPRLIVDLGCCTGRYAYALAERFAASVIGIDPSAKMIASAHAKPGKDGVEFCRASGEQLPLADGCADMVFLSMILHHLEDRPRAAEECRRVLRKGGRICVRNSTRDLIYPAHRFFPSTLTMLKSELPSRDEIIVLFETAGLRLKAYQLVSHRLATSWLDLADRTAMRVDSFLVRLPDAEFEAGMAALRAYALTRNRNESVLENIDFFVFGG